MEHFPIFLSLRGRPALIVGGGELALRKLRLLQKAGAQVTVVAPQIAAEIEDSGAALRRRGFVAGDVLGHDIVFAATGIAAVDDRVAEAASANGRPWNVVDRAEASRFILPAIVERDPIVVAISSGGAAPALARRLREAIERLLPARIGRLARFADGFRATVKAVLPDADSRRRFWERFFEGPVAQSVLAGRDIKARESMLGLVNDPAAGQAAPGIVHLVGAGPGSADLLTLRALQVMQRADAVVYDGRISAEVLDQVRRDAERIRVAGIANRPDLAQAEINALLARLAGDGKCVVRLKSGDPLVFARGGEELAYLRRRGVTVEVVPGITAALGCAASVGLSLTHPRNAQVVSLVAGEGGEGDGAIDWAALARPRQTLAIYMGVNRAAEIARQLIAGGLSPDTPVAVVENGTLPDQRGAVGRLGALRALIRETGIGGRAIVFVGEAARAASATPAVFHALAATA